MVKFGENLPHGFGGEDFSRNPYIVIQLYTKNFLLPWQPEFFMEFQENQEFEMACHKYHFGKIW